MEHPPTTAIQSPFNSFTVWLWPTEMVIFFRCSRYWLVFPAIIIALRRPIDPNAIDQMLKPFSQKFYAKINGMYSIWSVDCSSEQRRSSAFRIAIQTFLTCVPYSCSHTSFAWPIVCWKQNKQLKKKKKERKNNQQMRLLDCFALSYIHFVSLSSVSRMAHELNALTETIKT